MGDSLDVAMGIMGSEDVLSIWVPVHNSVPGNVTYVFYHNDGMLLHIFNGR